jgi:hypothetical protein
MLAIVLLANVSPTSTKLYSELFPNKKYKIKMPYKAWEGMPYKGMPYKGMKNILKISTDAYVWLTDPEHKKADKIGERSVKTVVVEFQNSSIFRLYNCQKDNIIVSPHITFNKDFDKVNDEAVGDTAEAGSPISNILVTPLPDAAVAPRHVSVKDSDEEDESSDNSVIPLIKPITRVPTPVVTPVPTPDPLAVGEVSKSPAKPKKPRGRPKKSLLIDPAVQRSQGLTLMEPVLAYPQNPNKKPAIKLTGAMLAKQDEALFNDPDIWFRLFRDFKVFVAKPKTRQPLVIAVFESPRCSKKQWTVLTRISEWM